MTLFKGELSDLQRSGMKFGHELNHLEKDDLFISGSKPFTPPKFNMEPEKRSLEEESPFGNHHFQVPC